MSRTYYTTTDEKGMTIGFTEGHSWVGNSPQPPC